MNQGNIEAAKKIWNFLRISTKGDFILTVYGIIAVVYISLQCL